VVAAHLKAMNLIMGKYNSQKADGSLLCTTFTGFHEVMKVDSDPKVESLSINSLSKAYVEMKIDA
jgi:hypothetical protein